MKNASDHYDKNYFEWQKNLGKFGGWANIPKFQKYIKPTDKVIEFGCGGGFLLKNITCKEKLGIEINDIAIHFATTQNHINVYNDIDLIQDEWADVIISNSALEHTLYPLDELKKLYKKLKKGGTIVFTVPCESITYKYVPNDINHHIYSWSPMAIGNLFTEAGFKVKESKPFISRWPKSYLFWSKFGRKIFDIVCTLCTFTHMNIFIVRVVAKKY